ncbi:MAG TPA: tyrosine-protein phosphatase [Pyrinomonadaceae bacterium]|jgi:protein tyrosine/serine phosphatase|nr:tyrosine-protein phosphatase [Pyrinomonadaceae bacterium]
MKNFSRALLLSLALVGGLVSVGFSQASPTKVFNDQKIKISNFGQLDERMYRGARPGKNDFATLKSIGIDTIIDLTDNTPEEQGLAEAAGLKYVNIPIKDKSYPTDEAVTKFIETMNNPETGKFFVHCAGGRHRTADMAAIYRFQQGWDYDKIYQEMLNFDFYTSNGHQKALDFVVDYSKKVTAQRAAAAGTGTVAGMK